MDTSEELCLCNCHEGFFGEHGFKGVLTHVDFAKSRVYKIERCDQCRFYKSDQQARGVFLHYYPKLVRGALRDGWWEEKLNHTEKVIAKRMLDGDPLSEAPLYISHPILKYFAKAALKGT